MIRTCSCSATCSRGVHPSSHPFCPSSFAKTSPSPPCILPQIQVPGRLLHVLFMCGRHLHLPAFFLKPRCPVASCMFSFSCGRDYVSGDAAIIHMYIHCAFVHLTLSHSLLHSLIHSFVNAFSVFPYMLVTCKPLIASCMRFCFGTRRTDIHVCRCCYNALRLPLTSLFDAFLARKQALHDLETL